MSEIPKNRRADAGDGRSAHKPETQWKPHSGENGPQGIREKKNKRREIAPSLEQVTLSHEQGDPSPLSELGEGFSVMYLPPDESFIVLSEEGIEPSHLIVSRPDRPMPRDPFKIFPQ